MGKARIDSSKTAFTLLEMAIVILIIALIAAGVVSGKSLVKGAEIREMMGEYDRHVKAIQEFQDKYNQLPGDMTNATSFWGADTCPTSAASSPKIATCNGSGDGKIGTSTSVGVVAAGSGGTSEEWFRAWQHLANAGLVPGKYSGTQGSGGAVQTVTGTNIPASKMGNGGWLLMIYYNTTGADNAAWGDSYGHILQFGASDSTNSRNTSPAMSPSDALSLDAKLDDGKPGTGKIRAWRTAVHTNCTTETTQTGSTYKTSYNRLACAPFFIMGF